jgi:D-tyrosyl-tRNA(Tyr) deacylase
MRALVQRVSEASVTVDGEIIGRIGHGLLVLVCAETGDGEDDARFFAGKIARMRIFTDDNGKMNLALGDVGGAVLAVSQFTLAARWRKGNRPGFSDAADPATGRRLYDAFCRFLRDEGIDVETGRFAADMKVALVNDGPVTIWMDSNDTRA